jgi:protein subunit release factor B
MHRPTGIEVKVQRYREQSTNRLSAWKLLILKIEEREKGSAARLQRAAFKIRKQKQKRSKRAQAEGIGGEASPWGHEGTAQSGGATSGEGSSAVDRA